MKITYDPEANALYIRLAPAGPVGELVQEILKGSDENIILDRKPDGTLVGIEVVGVDALQIEGAQ